jgi:alpha-glucosidase
MIIDIKRSLLGIVLCLTISAHAQEFKLSSPDQKITATITVNKNITYALQYNKEQVILPSVLALALADGITLGKNPKLLAQQTRKVDQIIKPLYGISTTIKETYSELSLNFDQNFSVIFRAYNEGFAYRFVTNQSDSLIVKSEQANFKFAENNLAYFHPIMSEANYRVQRINDYKLNPNYTSLPLLLKTTKGLNVLVHESDLFNYPCLTLESDSLAKNSLKGVFANYPKVWEKGGYSNFNLVVKKTADYIAKTPGKHNFPWRLVAFEEQDQDILTNQLVYLLASPSKLSDVSWIKPGKVAWDWWNSLNLTGVKFKTGFNTETYKYFIDFAAANGIAYINLDEGWSDQFDLLKVTEKLDMPALIRYAKTKKVGIVLWCVWHTLDRQMPEALGPVRKMGHCRTKSRFYGP